MANGKRIGSSFERDCAKKLTGWLTGQQKEYYFWRSPSSGGIATATGLNNELSGDLIPVKPEAKIWTDLFVTEIKIGYPQASLDLHLKANKSDPLMAFWEQVSFAANEANKYPFLIYRKKGMKVIWAGFTEPVFKRLYKNYLKDERFIHLSWENEELEDTYFFDFDKFLNNVKPMVIKNFPKRK